VRRSGSCLPASVPTPWVDRRAQGTRRTCVRCAPPVCARTLAKSPWGQQRCVLARRGTWYVRRVRTTARSGCALKLVMLIRPEGTALAKPRASRRERSER
jgi:hypothetical protein